MNRKQRQILLVDDEPIVREPVAVTLRLQGFSVHVASGMAEAEQRLAANYYDLVLLDIDMPDRSGLDLLCWIKSDARIRSIPVIMLTNSADLSVARMALDLGARDYVLKVRFSLQALIERVERALDGRAPTSPADKPQGSETYADSPTPASMPAIRTKADRTPSASIMDEATAMRLVSEHVAKRSFSGVINRILGVVADPKGSLADLVEALRRDPALSARVLQAANAAGSARVRSIASLEEAAQVIGTRAIRDLTLGLGLFDSTGGLKTIRYLQHSLATALLMEKFAPDPMEAALSYTIGLCHQLGDLAVRNAVDPHLELSAGGAAGDIAQMRADTAAISGFRQKLIVSAIQSMQLPGSVTAPIMDLILSDLQPAPGSRMRRLQIAASYAHALLLGPDPDAEVLPLMVEDRPDLGASAADLGLAQIRNRAVTAAASAVGGTPLPPLFASRQAACLYVRAPGGLAGDPFSVALSSLCRVIERDRLPRSISDWSDAGALVAVRGDREAQHWTGSLTRAVECGPAGATVLVVTGTDGCAGLPPGVITIAGKPTLAALAAVVLAADR